MIKIGIENVSLSN